MAAVDAPRGEEAAPATDAFLGVKSKGHRRSSRHRRPRPRQPTAEGVTGRRAAPTGGHPNVNDPETRKHRNTQTLKQRNTETPKRRNAEALVHLAASGGCMLATDGAPCLHDIHGRRGTRGDESSDARGLEYGTRIAALSRAGHAVPARASTRAPSHPHACTHAREEKHAHLHMRPIETFGCRFAHD